MNKLIATLCFMFAIMSLQAQAADTNQFSDDGTFQELNFEPGETLDENGDPIDEASWDHRRRGRWRWRFSYIDRNGCRSCQFRCYNAPRCDRRWRGYKMACRRPGTKNDDEVFVCKGGGWGRR